MSNGTSLNNHPLVLILQDKIKLYEHLGISFLEITDAKVRLKSLLSENTNHKGTAFGGSLYSVAVMAAYALALQGLRERNIPTENIVIQKGEIQYLKPVEGDFEVEAAFESQNAQELFYQTLQEKSRARGLITSQVFVGGDLKAVLRGTFVLRT